MSSKWCAPIAPSTVKRPRIAPIERTRRACQWHCAEDGTFVLHARLPAEVGALLFQALAAAVVTLWAGERMDLGMAVDGLLQADARRSAVQFQA